jgi:Xaa-Pro aminopeptidase
MPEPSFERSEYERRVELTEERMRERGLDALVVADPANMNYLSGYDGWSFYVHQFVLVDATREQPVWVGRVHDTEGARATTWIDDGNVFAYGDDHVQSPADRHPTDYLAAVLADLDLDDARIGVEMDAYYFTARAYERLRRNLPDATFADATLLVNRVRVVKSERELEYVAQAAQIAERAMEAGLDAVGEGVRESTAAAEILRTLVDGTEEFGGDYPAIVPLMPSGAHSGATHLTWSDRRFERGDPVIVELAGCRRRYHAPLTRTAFVGEAPAAAERRAEILLEGLHAALDRAEPGVTAAAVERAWRDVISRHGVEKEERIGYSVGLGYPPDWGEHTVSFRPGDETVLEPNMVFHLIPGLWLEDVGVVLSETIRVTDTGAEAITDFPRRLFVR